MLQGKTSLFDGRYNRLDSALFCTILFLCLFRISNYAICHFICHNYAKWVISWQCCSVAAMQWKRDAVCIRHCKYLSRRKKRISRSYGCWNEIVSLRNPTLSFFIVRRGGGFFEIL